LSDPRELYQQVIIEHNKKPRNYGDLEHHTHYAHGINPMCGDDIIVKVILDKGIIKDIRFQGQGCAIFKASSSLMTVKVKDKSVEDVEIIIKQFREMIRGDLITHTESDILGSLILFRGISNLPSRVKCAVLPWVTLHNALHGKVAACTE
jgi:nitrogen fixation NifU-like protein